MPGCMAYGCSCPSFEYEDGPRKPGPCENGCKAAADELAQQTQDMERCLHESWRVTSEWYDHAPRAWWKSRRCNDCGEALDNVLEDEPTFSEPKGPGSDGTPSDPFEGEQGNCATGATPEELATFERLKAKYREIKSEDKPAFKAGDKVRTKAGDDVTIQGPSFMSYVVQYENGTVRTFAADSLKPIPPGDPKVSVVRNVLLPMIADAELRAAIACDVVAALDAWWEGD